MDDTTEIAAALGNTYFTPPKSFRHAVALIQRLSLSEKGGVNLDPDFFDMDYCAAFAWVGFLSAVIDTVLWVVIFVAGGIAIRYYEDHYAVERTVNVLWFVVNGSLVFWISKLGSFSGHLFHTGLSFWSARFYRGTVTKKAWHWLIFPRSIFLGVFGVLTFYAMGLVYRYVTTPDVFQKVYEGIALVHGYTAESVYVFLDHYIRRFLFEGAIIAIVVPAVSIALPFLGIPLYRLCRKKDQLAGPRDRED